MSCLDNDALVAYVEGTLSAADRLGADHHLARCPACRRLLSDLARALSHTVAPGGEDPEEPNGSAPAPLGAGSRVDHFQVIRLIGRGGMGEVYLARDMVLGRKVALKVVHPESLGSQEAIDRFLLEARTTAQFNHLHIVTIHGVGEHQGSPYMALEYLEGQTLRQRMDEERQSLKECLRIGLCIAEALAEAHRHGVLHRDLTPRNVLLCKDGRPRVLDFGLAQVQAHGASAAVALDQTLPARSPSPAAGITKGLRGTPIYMSPEQWREEECTPATDVWALGLILFELVSGRRPYQDSPTPSLSALCRQVKSRDPVPSVRTLEEFPANLTGLADLIDGCLIKDPAERPSAAEGVLALKGLLSEGHGRLSDEESPFRGLLPFTEQHTDLFFGRETEVGALVERLRHDTILPVVGPSGAGKSSFVQAGVIPRLRELGSWTVLTLRPGAQPFVHLASRLLSGQGSGSGPPRKVLGADELAQSLFSSPLSLSLALQRLAVEHRSSVLLFVDQLEEIYTLVEDENIHHRFMAAICGAALDPQDRVRIIFTLRDDFLGRLAGGVEAQQALSQMTVLGSLGGEALRRVLCNPVQAAGYKYDDPDLVEQMVAAVHGEPAGLPLLQFAAQLLWEGRDTQARLLRRADYEEMGGVAGALAQHADGVLSVLTPQQVHQARDLLLRLVTAEGTRRVLSRERVVEGLGQDADAVLDRLVHGRLLTMRRSRTGEGTAAELELAHESLTRTWRRLAAWIEEGREDLTFLAEIEQAADLWEKRGKKEEEVWHGDALQVARRTVARCTAPVPERARRFLQAGEAKERRTLRRRRGIWASGIGLLMVIALCAVAVAWAFVGKEREARLRWAEAQREGARGALDRGDVLEARAKLRASLEVKDSPVARGLWWQLSRDPLLWERQFSKGMYPPALSPDGSLVAAALWDGSLYLLDTRTRSARILRGHRDQLLPLVFAPSSKLLASGSWDGEVRIWDVASGKTRLILAGHTDRVHALAFSRDGKLLASGSWDRTIRIWDVATGGIKAVLTGDLDKVYRVAFSPDGSLLASSGASLGLHIWDLATKTIKKTLAWKNEGTRGIALAFSPDGRLLATAMHKTVKIFDVREGRVTRVLFGHSGPILGVEFSPEGRRLISVSWDQTLRTWDLATGAEQQVIHTQQESMFGLSLSADGRLLATGSPDGRLRLWDLAAGAWQAPSSGHRNMVMGAVFSPDARQVLTGSADKTVRVWDVASGQAQLVLRSPMANMHTIAMHPLGKLLATGGQGRGIQIWDVAGGTEERVLGDNLNGTYSLAFHPDGHVLASGNEDKSIRLWDLTKGSPFKVLSGHQGRIMDLDFSPDGKQLASAADDQTVRVWDLATFAHRTLHGHSAAVNGVAFGPTGEILASSSDDGTVRIWDLREGKSRILGQVPARMNWPSFHPSGRFVGAASSDGLGRIWDVERGTALLLSGHKDEVNYLRFSRDGKLVVTTSDDQTVRLWRAESGRPLWRAPVLLADPPQIFTHTGWARLDGAAVSGLEAKWRQAVAESARAGSEAKGTLCLLTHGEALEIWDVLADRLLFRAAVPGIAQVLALPSGCLVRAAGNVQIYDRSGKNTDLTSGVRTVAWSQGALLVALSRQVRMYDPSGRQTAAYDTDVGVTALAQSGAFVVLGFQDGNIELIPTEPGRPRPSTSFEQVPASPVLRMIEGPMGTLIGGYANGFLGVWSLQSGALLEHFTLHGPVVHLLLAAGTLYAATDLGQHVTLDLTTLGMDYCDLLKQLWNRVPVLWEGGLPVLREPPKGHRCLSR